MRTSFIEICPKCGTLVRIDEVGEKNPAKTYDFYYCPVCGISIGQKNTLYFFKEAVESLDNSKEPYKAEYLRKKEQ